MPKTNRRGFLGLLAGAAVVPMVPTADAATAQADAPEAPVPARQIDIAPIHVHAHDAASVRRFVKSREFQRAVADALRENHQGFAATLRSTLGERP